MTDLILPDGVLKSGRRRTGSSVEYSAATSRAKLHACIPCCVSFEQGVSFESCLKRRRQQLRDCLNESLFRRLKTRSKQSNKMSGWQTSLRRCKLQPSPILLLAAP
eukprot:2385436-Pleurochrysis_carterae.AAC.5